MQCKIESCDRQAAYKDQQVCQKHYFRHMRTGQYDLKRSENGTRKPEVGNHGYVLIFKPDHILSQKHGLLLEHRFVMFEKYGINLPDCEFCGKESNWFSRSTHIDHIDTNRQNNKEDNLRVLCNACNTRREKRLECETKGHYKVT